MVNLYNINEELHYQSRIFLNETIVVQINIINHIDFFIGLNMSYYIITVKSIEIL